MKGRPIRRNRDIFGFFGITVGIERDGEVGEIERSQVAIDQLPPQRNQPLDEFTNFPQFFESPGSKPGSM